MADFLTPNRQKGLGYFGTLNRPNGGVSTELSIGIEMDGREVEIPTLVPTLTEEERKYLLTGSKPTKAIIDKAVSHARTRMSQGKSPFAQIGEQNKGGNMATGNVYQDIGWPYGQNSVSQQEPEEDFMSILARALGDRQRASGTAYQYTQPQDYGALGEALETKDRIINSNVGKFSGSGGRSGNQRQNYWDMMHNNNDDNGEKRGSSMTFRGNNTAKGEQENPLAGWLQAIQGTGGGTDPLMAILSLLTQGWGRQERPTTRANQPYKFGASNDPYLQ